MNLTQAVAKLRELTSKFEEAEYGYRIVVEYQPDSALFDSDKYTHVVFVDEKYVDESMELGKFIFMALVKKDHLVNTHFNGVDVTLLDVQGYSTLITQKYNE